MVRDRSYSTVVVHTSGSAMTCGFQGRQNLQENSAIWAPLGLEDRLFSFFLLACSAVGQNRGSACSGWLCFLQIKFWASGALRVCAVCALTAGLLARRARVSSAVRAVRKGGGSALRKAEAGFWKAALGDVDRHLQQRRSVCGRPPEAQIRADAQLYGH